MGNKIKYNLKNVHAAKLTETVTSGVTSYTYATPQAIPGAVSLALDAEGESTPFYADGIVYFRSATNNGYKGDLEIALIPEWFRTTKWIPWLSANGWVQWIPCTDRSKTSWVLGSRQTEV